MKKHKNNEVKVKVLTLGISKKTRKRLCKSDRKMINEIMQIRYFKIPNA